MCLLCLNIEVALLASSLLWSLLLFHVVGADRKRILHLNFGVDALLAYIIKILCATSAWLFLSDI